MEVVTDIDRYDGDYRIYSRYVEREKHTTPNFHQKVRDGIYVAPLPYYINELIIKDPMREFILGSKVYNKNLIRYTKSQKNFASNPYLGIPSLPSPVRLQGNLESRLLSRLNDNEMNLAMTWFERKDTFSMITARALQLVTAIRLVRRGKFKEAAKVLGVGLPRRKKRRMNERGTVSFSENWLELRYGWTPLYYDIHNAAAIIAAGLNKTSGVIKLNTHESSEESFPYFAHPTPSGFTQNFVAKRKLRHGLGIHFKVIDPQIRFLESLGLRNPALIAWELVPFSFVADWFLPIGDELRKLTAFDGLHFMGGYEYWKENTVLSYSPWSKRGYFRWYGGEKHYQITWYDQCRDTRGDRASYTRNCFERRTIGGFDQINQNPWQTHNGLNAVRALDAVALVRQVLLS